VKHVVFAAAAHPDDIEFMMAGTLILLREKGCEIHVMNVANGSCGTPTLSIEEIVAKRKKEAQNAAAVLSATLHPPLVNDMEIFYERPLLAKLCAVVRQIKPDILLVPSHTDYMEDHQNVSRLMVSAGFCRGMQNFPANPPLPPIQNSMAVYQIGRASCRERESLHV
jgi:N-acetylglucosamine malate deacetylase 1